MKKIVTLNVIKNCFNAGPKSARSISTDLRPNPTPNPARPEKPGPTENSGSNTGSGVQKCGHALAPRYHKLAVRKRDLQRRSSAYIENKGLIKCKSDHFHYSHHAPLTASKPERRRAGKWWSAVPCPLLRGATWAEVPFHNSIICHFMVYKDRLEKTLLQLFAHPEHSEWFSRIFIIIYGFNIVAEQKQA